MIVAVTNNLITREAKYHKILYQDYTRPNKKLIEDLSYDILRNVTDSLFSEDIVISLNTFKRKCIGKLSENDIGISYEEVN